MSSVAVFDDYVCLYDLCNSKNKLSINVKHQAPVQFFSVYTHRLPTCMIRVVDRTQHMSLPRSLYNVTSSLQCLTRITYFKEMVTTNSLTKIYIAQNNPLAQSLDAMFWPPGEWK